MPRILIIDNNQELSNTLKQLLERANYDVTVADSCNDGVTTFQEEPADVVITDLIASNQEGIQAIQTLLRHYSSARIIAMFGGEKSGEKSSPAWLPLAKKMGMVTLLNKPFTNEQLLNTVYHALTY